MVRVFVVLPLLVFAAGCVTPPPAQPPLPVAKPGGSFSIGRVKALDQTDYMTQHVDRNRNILYFQNFGGGGAAVGLLLGPLGVAANMSMIESNTKQDIEQLRDKIVIDPPAAFMVAAKRAGTALQPEASAEAPRVSPYLYLTKTSPETIVLAAALLVESPDAAAPWTRKYMWQLPATFTLGSLAALDQATTSRINLELEAGYEDILRAMARESADSVAREQQVKFKSPFLNPRFEFELIANLAAEEQDLVWVRAPGGLFGIRRSHITYTPAPKP